MPAGKKPNENKEGKYLIKNEDGNVSPQNAPNSDYLQGLTHKLNGDLLQAAECYEKELGHVLRNAPSGIGDFFLSAWEPRYGREETGQDTGSPASESSMMSEPGQRGRNKTEQKAREARDGGR